MKKEVVQDFLNLPGIAGVALMDGRSRPYFLGIDQTLNFQQKETLAIGIQQVIETTPADFEFFEFQFIGHQIYIYKLSHGIILLVLIREGLVHSSFIQAVERLRDELQTDYANAIATFRMFAGTATLTGQSYRTPPTSASMISKAPPSGNGATRPPIEAAEPSPAPPPSTPSASSISPKELLVAMNKISEFTQQYLGATVVSNYLKSSRPPVDWLSQFEIERSGKLTCASLSNLPTSLDATQQQVVQQWIAAFMKRCSIVIRDFPTLIQQIDLDERHKSLLFSKPS